MAVEHVSTVFLSGIEAMVVSEMRVKKSSISMEAKFAWDWSFPEMSRSPIDLSLLAVTAAADGDMEFSFQVKKAAEGALITAVFGWDEGVQRDFHAEEWRQRRPDVIRYGGVRIGTIRARV